LRDIDCFNIKKGYYKITEDGKVYSNIYNKFLSCKYDKDGYLDLCLVCEDNKRRHFRIHRLVAEVYIGNPNNYPIVLHLDNDKQNNHYSNLKWGTVQENTQQAYDDGCCTWNKPVFLYDRKHKYLIKKFNSISDLARYFEYSRGNETNLGKMCRGELPQAKKGKLKDYIITHERL
jgi:hypothetical protein